MFLKSMLPCVKKENLRSRATWNALGLLFTFLDIDLVEELNKLNSLLVKYELYEYGEFSVSLDHLFLPDRAFAFLSKKITKKEIENGYNNI